MPVLAPDVEEFLAGPHVAALATVRENGRPHVVPVWYVWDGRQFTISSFRELQKVKNVARKGFAALSIYTTSLPYRQVTVEGTASVGGPLDNVWRERLAVRYLGEAAGRAYVRDTFEIDAVAILVRPYKWHIEGFGLEGSSGMTNLQPTQLTEATDYIRYQSKKGVDSLVALMQRTAADWQRNLRDLTDAQADFRSPGRMVRARRRQPLPRGHYRRQRSDPPLHQRRLPPGHHATRPSWRSAAHPPPPTPRR